MSEEFPRLLDATLLSDEAKQFQDFLLSKIIGQDRAIKQFVRVFQQISVGMNRRNRPAGVFLFTGPTGVGKTELVRRAAEHLLGNKNSVTRIDCGEFQHSHEVAKIIGSPPGYVGHGDKKSIRLSQENINKFQTATCKLNIILFDEIEEAHDTLLSAILQILDAGRLTLGTGDETDFSHSIVILTSNLGEKDVQKTMAGSQLGLAPEKNVVTTDEDIYKVSKAAAAKHFKAKFMNRIDRLVVFRSLDETNLRRILQNELGDLQERVWESSVRLWEESGGRGDFPQFRPVFQFTDAAKDFLIREGTSRLYGARELNRALDRFVAFPIGALIGSKQVHHGDIVEGDYEAGAKALTFKLIGKRDVTPLLPATYKGVPLDDLISEPNLPMKYEAPLPVPERPKRKPWKL